MTGGNDSGATGNGFKEKDINLLVGLKVGKVLKDNNIKVFYSRTDDTFIELPIRSQMANDLATDVFVSIHVNDHSDVKVQGIETFSYPNSKNGAALAKSIQDSLIKDKLHTKNRGIKTANFSVLRRTKMPAVLVELGFIRNKEDIQILKNKQDELAESVAKGILKNLGIDYKSNPAKPEIDKTHWAEKHYDNLNSNGIKVDEKRFDDSITRGEVFSLLDQVVKKKI